MSTAPTLERPRITLDRVDEIAALQTRIDRKYLVDEVTARDLVDQLPMSAHVLEIDARIEFGYRSTYFDTADLALYRAAAHRHRRRFKVRTRTYTDTGDTYLEVKTKGARGANVKSRIEVPDLTTGCLTTAGRTFIDETTGTHDVSEHLEPVLTTEYTRSTIVDVDGGGRFTIDRDLRCSDGSGRSATLDRVVVETKSSGAPSAADRWLWQHHVRPQRISKFCTGLAALHPDLPSNRWHRVLDRCWHADQAA
ncbi:polyphosphate polymerase domain-containing protein [Ilumatobacter nonamiensis]|uniref:polyphosphate polymerase domain-containing protein n=1 Tax=Ilumatobacter nonamiensis TaxID=467093 RepID=UPI0003491B3B|nr:polyphosphate polymerase domain-containing protein [Ilumatobacter nonamiensis]